MDSKSFEMKSIYILLNRVKCFKNGLMSQQDVYYDVISAGNGIVCCKKSIRTLCVTMRLNVDLKPRGKVSIVAVNNVLRRV